MGWIDYTKCSDNDCKSSTECWRKTISSNAYRQSYMDYSGYCPAYKRDNSISEVNMKWDGTSKIERRITISNKSVSLSVTDSFNSLANDICGEDKWTTDNILEFFETGRFDPADIKYYNGKHFLHGFMETLYQSEEYANLLTNVFSKIDYIYVEEIK